MSIILADNGAPAPRQSRSLDLAGVSDVRMVPVWHGLGQTLSQPVDNVP
jgi:hypothetical protein